jgi:hypothetical protein
MNGSFPARVVLALLLASSAPLAAQRCPLPEAVVEGLEGALAHVRYLSDDDLAGRAVASAGERCASTYLVEAFREIGLRPAGTDRSYFHAFPVRTGTELGPTNMLDVDGLNLDTRADWAPVGVSASARVEAPLVYAGFGVSSPGSEADRSTGVDLAGRIAVVEWGDPDAPDHPSLRVDPAFKARVAAGRDAAGLLILLSGDDVPPGITEETAADVGIPVAVVGGSRADQVRAAAERGATARIETDVRPVTSEARNVVAMVRGSDSLAASEYVVVGAHYDHLGLGGAGSLDQGEGRIHNGADDNASGTAALIEVARAVSRARPARTVVFMAFTGEERGLLGSRFFVAQPTIPLERSVAMINLDMVGRLEDRPLIVNGTATAAEWPELISGANGSIARPLELELHPSGSGPSDHASFDAAGVPVLHFFTGTHSDYHRPGDDWQKIDGAGLERIIDLVAALVVTLATPSDVPVLSPEG